MKRALDIAVAALSLIVVFPVIMVLIVLIRRDSPGPGIFVQERIGRYGKTFRCLKLRTMRAGSPNVPTHDAAPSYTTSIGNILRRTKLDELPQLLNVLRGEMSLVGPRPCLPSQSKLLAEREKLGVHSLRPGITGLAQVSGIDMSDPIRLAQEDAEYLHNHSIYLDIKLMVMTVLSLRNA